MIHPTPAGIARRAKRLRDAVDDRLPHGRRVLRYRGFALVHSRRDSLVDLLRQQGDYEPRTIGAIVAALERSPTQTFVDVGANIGLVSLAVLAALPDARIFAFEPGPHQHDLLAATIRRNRLESSISLSAVALSDRAGTAPFAVHPARLSPGDGFRDTGRAGRMRLVTVETQTLDGWWERSGRPRVDVVKLDTEGSELLVLKGATAFLAEARPVLFLEIHPLNLRPYGLTQEDVRAEVEALGYELEPLSRTEFVATPT